MIILAQPASGGEPTLPPPRAVSAAYDLYWKGIRVFSAKTHAWVGNAAYGHAVSIRTRGILSLFLKAHGEAQATGIRYGKGNLLPVSYASRSQWNKKNYARMVTFNRDGSAERVLMRMPRDRDGEWEPVPDNLMQGPDPLSLLLAGTEGLWGMAEGKVGEVTLRAFDGARVMEYVVACRDGEILKKTRRSIFAGSAIRCEVEGTQLAGFWMDMDEEQTSREESAEDGAGIDRRVILWLAADSQTGLYLPVRMEIRSRRGKLKVYLTKTDATLGESRVFPTP